MYVCMYVYMYVCMYVCVYVCMYARMYVCTLVCMYVHTYVWMYALCTKSLIGFLAIVYYSTMLASVHSTDLYCSNYHIAGKFGRRKG